MTPRQTTQHLIYTHRAELRVLGETPRVPRAVAGAAPKAREDARPPMWMGWDAGCWRTVRKYWGQYLVKGLFTAALILWLAIWFAVFTR